MCDIEFNASQKHEWMAPLTNALESRCKARVHYVAKWKAILISLALGAAAIANCNARCQLSNLTWNNPFDIVDARCIIHLVGCASFLPLEF